MTTTTTVPDFALLSEGEQRLIAERLIRIQDSGWKPFWCPDQKCSGDPHLLLDAQGTPTYAADSDVSTDERPLGDPVEGLGRPLIDPHWAHNHAREDQRLLPWSLPWTLFIMSGRGCVAPWTLIDLADGTSERIDTLAQRAEAVEVMTPDGPCWTDGAPFKKGEARQWQVRLSNGEVLTVTDKHRFLAPGGWLTLDHVRAGQPLVAAVPADLGSDGPQSHDDPSGWRADARRCWSTELGSGCGCPTCRRPGGLPLPPASDDDRDGTPSPAGAAGRSRLSSLADVLVTVPAGSRPCRPSGPPTRKRSSRAWRGLAGGRYRTGSVHVGSSPQTLANAVTSPASTTPGQPRPAGPLQRAAQAVARLFGSSRPQHAGASALSGSTRPSPPRESSSSRPLGSERSDLVWVESLTYSHFGPFYDLTVPGPESYHCGGVVSHNSGKTKVGTEFVTLCARKGLDGAILGRRGTELVNTHVKRLIEEAHPEFVPIHNSSKDTLTWPEVTLPDGTKYTPITFLFSAEKPENIRSVNLSYCHPAGTLIQTEHGAVPIEDVRVGERVWTREGLRAVGTTGARRAVVHEIEHGDGRVQRVSGNHPLWTDAGWCEARLVQPGDTLGVWTNLATQPAASSHSDGRGEKTGTPDGSSGTGATRESTPRSTSPERSTGTTSVQSLGVSRSTMSTGTEQTTDPRTSSRSPGATTGLSTLERTTSAPAQTVASPSGDSATASGASPAKSLGTLNSNGPLTSNESTPAPAAYVGPTFYLDPATTAPSDASTSGETGPTLTATARTVEGLSLGARRRCVALSASEPTSTGKHESDVPVLAWSSVTRVRVTTEQEVYSLGVERTPEYFADGVLVHNCWVDEAAFMDEIESAWDNLELASRVISAGNPIHHLITSTPTATKWVMDMEEDEDVEVRRVSTFANAKNLDPGFLAKLVKKYQGTRKGRQELNGEILRDVEGALWNDEMYQYLSFTAMKDGAVKFQEFLSGLDDVVVAVDPAGSKGKRSDATGIVGIGAHHFDDNDERMIASTKWVLGDATIKGSPTEWAAQTFKAARLWGARRIVAEKNYGGDMVKQVLQDYAKLNPTTACNANGDPFRIDVVHAEKSKEVRAEGTVGRYEQGLVTHVTSPTLFGDLAELETEQTTWVPKSRGGRHPSPNRIDALVWADRALETNVTYEASTATAKGIAAKMKKPGGTQNPLGYPRR